MSAVVHHGPGAFPSHLLAAEQGMGTFGDHDGLLFPVNGAGLVQAECGRGSPAWPSVMAIFKFLLLLPL